MSRGYEVLIEVTDLEDEDEGEKVKTAILEVEGLGVHVYGASLQAEGDITLGGGQTEDDWSEEVAKAIWKVTNRAVEITVSWWDKDRDPDETCFFGEPEFLETLPALTQLAAVAKGKKGDN